MIFYEFRHYFFSHHYYHYSLIIYLLLLSLNLIIGDIKTTHSDNNKGEKNTNINIHGNTNVNNFNIFKKLGGVNFEIFVGKKCCIYSFLFRFIGFVFLNLFN